MRDEVKMIGPIGVVGACRACLAVLMALVLFGCDRAQAAASQANVLLVVFDTTRFDDWSIFEPERQVTPVIDGIAARGQRFRNAYSLYSVTIPSHVTLFTGHAARDKVDHAIAGDAGQPADVLKDPRYNYRRSSIFTILHERGYRTYAFAGNVHVSQGNVEALAAVDASSRKKLTRLARKYSRQILEQHGEDRDPEAKPSRDEQFSRRRARQIVARSAAYVNGEAMAAMREHAAKHGDAPYLLFVNYNDAHDPYFPEAPWDARFASPEGSKFNGDLWSRRQRQPGIEAVGLALSMTSAGLSRADIERARALHLGELAYADHHLGLLVDELTRLGLMDSTVIVLVSDHGEAFGEGRRMAHAGWGDQAVVEALLHVPLVMSFPDRAISPSVIEQRVDLRDVKPTLLDYLGIADDSSRGRSLLPLIRGERASLPPAELRPQDRSPEAVGSNLIGGQGAEATERLEAELRELGYIE